jgi:hypothetical protein
MLITGGLLAGAGAGIRQPALTLGGAAIATVGYWVRIDAAGVIASEPYVAPVALYLLLAGLGARRTGAGSWLAYAPAIALAGGTAMAERLAGGGSGHALVAGAVGVAAVMAGGARRLSAPLVLGTSLLVLVVGNETLATAATVPTWAWLALGGTTLLTGGVVMERHQTGPFEAGRRMVDVLRDQFA